MNRFERRRLRHRVAGCQKPPEGWWCSRLKGHEGPCAARPTKLRLEWPEEKGPEQGISSIEIDGNEITVTGWFDDVANWSAAVTLSDHQMRLLTDFLG